MGLRINTNVVSLAAQRTLGNTGRGQSKTLKKLATGSRIVSSGDDAAGLAISEKLRATIRGTNQAARNANDGISMIQVAEGGLERISSILTRLRELSVQAATDTVDEVEKGFTDLEFQNLKEEIDRIASVTDFNGKYLLTGESEKYDFQVGINNDQALDRIEFRTGMLNATTDNLGIESLAVDSKGGAQDSLAALSGAIEKVSSQRAELGAKHNRLQSTVENLQVSSENLSAAESRIRDADYALETANNAKYNILHNAGTFVLAQANTQGGNSALKLIG